MGNGNNSLFVPLYVPSGNTEITYFLWILLTTELIAPRHTLLHLHAFHSYFHFWRISPYRGSAALPARPYRSAALIVGCGEGRHGGEQEDGLGSNNDTAQISFHDSLAVFANTGSSGASWRGGSFRNVRRPIRSASDKAGRKVRVKTTAGAQA